MLLERRESSESIWSLAAFWLVAFTASGLFAAVLLAPKWEQTEQLTGRVAQLADQCQYLSDGNERLERVLDALKHDPDFTIEIARSELDYGLPDEHRSPAPPQHRRDAKPPRSEPHRPNSWTPVLRLFAGDAVVRNTALITAAIFAVVGLAFFHPPLEPRAADVP